MELVGVGLPPVSKKSVSKPARVAWAGCAGGLEGVPAERNWGNPCPEDWACCFSARVLGSCFVLKGIKSLKASPCVAAAGLAAPKDPIGG